MSPFLAILFLNLKSKARRLSGLASLVALSAISVVIAAVVTTRAPTFALNMIPS